MVHENTCLQKKNMARIPIDETDMSSQKSRANLHDAVMLDAPLLSAERSV